MMLNADVVAGFVGSVLSSRFDGQAASPPFHRECWELCTSTEKYVAIAAPRGHAKSTAITLGYGLATLLFRERKFLLLVSDTESQAAMFLNLFKQEIQDNNELIDLFGIKRNEKGLVDFKEKGSETDLIVECSDGHKFRIIAKGAEQKLRGLIWNGSRPDIIICDDMENDELVMNKDRRDKMRRWFNGALLPSLADRGIVRMVGTILHSDSLLESLMPNPSDKMTVSDGLKEYTSRRGMWKAMKYRAHTADFKTLLWPQKKTSEYFRVLYEEAVKTGMTDTYSREYLNYPIDEAVSFFKRGDFLPIREEDKKNKLNFYITADLAISEEEKADYSVFVVAGVDEDKRIHIKNVIRERMDGKEIVDTFIALQRMYDPVAMGVEDMQVSKAIGPFLREEMVKQNTYISLYPLKHGGKDKVTRARNIQARMRAHGVKFATGEDWFPVFENECLTFPRGKHDDQVDAFAYLGAMLDLLVEAPTPQEEEDEAYEYELEQSGMNKQGRSSVTGY
jgi:predicted phage terminase large subunit-like protein